MGYKTPEEAMKNTYPCAPTAEKAEANGRAFNEKEKAKEPAIKELEKNHNDKGEQAKYTR